MGTTGAACFKKKQDVNTTHYFLCETCGHGVFLQTSTDTAFEGNCTCHFYCCYYWCGSVDEAPDYNLVYRSLVAGKVHNSHVLALQASYNVALRLFPNAKWMKKKTKKKLPACCMIFFQLEIGLQLAGVDSSGVWEQTSNAIVESTWVVARREMSTKLIWHPFNHSCSISFSTTDAAAPAIKAAVYSYVQECTR